MQEQFSCSMKEWIVNIVAPYIPDERVFVSVIDKARFDFLVEPKDNDEEKFKKAHLAILLYNIGFCLFNNNHLPDKLIRSEFYNDIEFLSSYIKHDNDVLLRRMSFCSFSDIIPFSYEEKKMVTDFLSDNFSFRLMPDLTQLWKSLLEEIRDPKLSFEAIEKDERTMRSHKRRLSELVGSEEFLNIDRFDPY